MGLAGQTVMASGRHGAAVLPCQAHMQHRRMLPRTCNASWLAKRIATDVQVSEPPHGQQAQRRLLQLAVAELEREYILQRQREGIAIAKKQCKYTGRQPRPLPDNFERVVAR